MTAVVNADPDTLVANATYTGQNGLMSQVEGLLYLGSWSKLQIVVTVLLILISYDQGMSTRYTGSWF